MKNSEKAVNLFTDGYNCAQAVFGAFADDLGFDESTALKIAAPFGGGFGRLREAETGDIKMAHYQQTRELCNKFKEQNGSIICREILKTAEVGGTPEKRTQQYYNERPCVRCVRTACEILEEYIKNKE